MKTSLPTGLSPVFWSVWYPGRNASVSESLEPGESWIGGWDGVGLYEGNNKVPEYQTISFHLTTHRLILIPEPPPIASSSKLPNSLQTHLSNVRQTEFYTGFMRSSAKITLTLGRPPPTEGEQDGVSGSNINTNTSSDDTAASERSWTCAVCGYVNPLERSETRPGLGSKCGLCGIAWSVSRNSVPSSRSGTPKPTQPSTPMAPSTSTLNQTPLQPPLEPSEGPSTTGEDTSVGKDRRIACPACTFLNHPTLPFCEICSTPLPKKQTIGSTSAFVPINSTTSGESGGKTEIVRLSFRRGGEKEGYRRLKNVLSDKAWERRHIQTRRGQDHGVSDSTNRISGATRSGAGIDGILQSISLDAKAQDAHRQDAFKDLEVLMVRAGEMVKLAQSLNTKLSASQTAVPEEDATLIRNSLVQLGLEAPALTQDMVRDEQRYLDGLARELGGLLTGRGGGEGLMIGKEGRGVIGLDEVWGLWMRARGLALLPPSTLMSILSHLTSHTSPPIHVLDLPSGLKVLHTPKYSPPSLFSRIHARLAYDESIETNEERSSTLLEISSYENLPIGLTKELMESIEALASPPGVREVFGLVRDDQAVGDGGTRWYRDIISVWDLGAEI